MSEAGAPNLRHFFEKKNVDLILKKVVGAIQNKTKKTQKHLLNFIF